MKTLEKETKRVTRNLKWPKEEELQEQRIDVHAGWPGEVGAKKIIYG